MAIVKYIKKSMPKMIDADSISVLDSCGNVYLILPELGKVRYEFQND